MSEGFDSTEVLRLLDDEYARTILTATSDRPMSAKELKEEVGASLPTVYRRVEGLLEQGLVVESTEIDPDGNHYNRYEAAVDHIDIDIQDGMMNIDVSRTTDPADRFTSAWERIRGDER
ncbi:helix-turn-helix domain-containing protein [Halobium salinum]|uniref:Helix-turn-helix domain-containing protein n=1 Tax=Halobium salinum TaxID=1364940 RepID=A0ABD5PJD3_9EURY|nr:helix-turn-helix domain-containing protein [Halobium salinum]